MAGSAAIHPQALCESSSVGAGTRVAAFAHIQAEARIGEDCDIRGGVFMENDVIVGNRVTVQCGAQLWDGVRLEDDVFVGPNTTFTKDKHAPMRDGEASLRRILVRQGAAIGANATILPGLEIGVGARVGAGAVVTRSIPANAIVYGNPARIKGYVDSRKLTAPAAVSPAASGGKPCAADIGVGRARLHELKLVKDARGALSVAEFEHEVPFAPKRFFLVFDVPSRDARGEHAHKACAQFLICVRGSCSILLDDGWERREIRLDRPDLGVYMPPMIWGTQYAYTADAALLVFASEPYDPDDYIRTYDEFLARLGR